MTLFEAITADLTLKAPSVQVNGANVPVQIVFAAKRFVALTARNDLSCRVRTLSCVPCRPGFLGEGIRRSALPFEPLGRRSAVGPTGERSRTPWMPWCRRQRFTHFHTIRPPAPLVRGKPSPQFHGRITALRVGLRWPLSRGSARHPLRNALVSRVQGQRRLGAIRHGSHSRRRVARRRHGRLSWRERARR